MIIVNLSGGLGNQMFQYACARSLSLDLGLPLKVIYGSSIGQTVHNGYELSRVFALNLDFATEADIQNCMGFLLSKSIIRKLYSKGVFHIIKSNRFFPEKSFHYNEDQFSMIKNEAFLQGYWQSEKYFFKHKSIIKSDFKFVDMKDEENISLFGEIKEQRSIGVHVRRGDYLTNKKAKAIHGICSLNYYLDSIEFLKRVVGDSQLFIFSDDSSWVEKNLLPRYANAKVVQHNSGTSSFNDMRLMSTCDHNIISNSSFSWWGAWLNSYPDKIVIAPKNWFANEEINSSDLIPDSWILL